MKIVISIKKKHVYALLILAVSLALANLAIAITASSAFHPLQDIAKTATDLTSVDADSNGTIDLADFAKAVAWTGITGKPSSFADNVISWGEVSEIPSGFADNVDNVGITSESDPTVSTSVKTGSTGAVFGGLYEVYGGPGTNTGAGDPGNCLVGNPLLGADGSTINTPMPHPLCACPPGFAAKVVYRGWVGNGLGNTLWACWKSL